MKAKLADWELIGERHDKHIEKVLATNDDRQLPDLLQWRKGEGDVWLKAGGVIWYESYYIYVGKNGDKFLAAWFGDTIGIENSIDDAKLLCQQHYDEQKKTVKPKFRTQ